MRKLLAIVVLAAVALATPALAKVKRVKAKPVQCAVWAAQDRGCTPGQVLFHSTIVTAGDISTGIINGVVSPFR